VHLEKLLLKARSWSSHENGLQILASKRNTHTTNPRQQMLCTIHVIWTGSLWSSSVTQASNSTRQELLVSLLLCVCSRHFQYFYLLFGNHQLNVIIPSIQTTTTGHFHFEIIQVFMYYPRLAASLYCTTFWNCSNKSAAMRMVITLESHYMGASEKSKKKKINKWKTQKKLNCMTEDHCSFDLPPCFSPLLPLYYFLLF
jgi:hypothetical protein